MRKPEHLHLVGQSNVALSSQATGQMSASDPEASFRQTGWPGLRARLFHTVFLIRRPMTLGVRALIHDRAAGTVMSDPPHLRAGLAIAGRWRRDRRDGGQALVRELLEECEVALTAPAGAEVGAFQPPVEPARPCAVLPRQRFPGDAPRSCRTSRSPRPGSSRSTICRTTRRRQRGAGSPRFSRGRRCRRIGEMAASKPP